MATLLTQNLDSISTNRSLQIQDITSGPNVVLDTTEFLASDLSTDELTQVVGGATILGGGQTAPGLYEYTVASGGHVFSVSVIYSPFDGSRQTIVEHLTDLCE
ncbi:hypothetical protein [Altericista sp. CCNU0014]|uniref:hypothetical protein n=1 Tax=Altericista sp. CCNU0014 TaxID=3082949 RepID=UPI003850115F